MGLAWCWASEVINVVKVLSSAGQGRKRPRVPSITLTSWSYKSRGPGLCCSQRRQAASGPLSPGHARAPLTFGHFFQLPDCSLALPRW